VRVLASEVAFQKCMQMVDVPRERVSKSFCGDTDVSRPWTLAAERRVILGEHSHSQRVICRLFVEAVLLLCML